MALRNNLYFIRDAQLEGVFSTVKKDRLVNGERATIFAAIAEAIITYFDMSYGVEKAAIGVKKEGGKTIYLAEYPGLLNNVQLVAADLTDAVARLMISIYDPGEDSVTGYGKPTNRKKNDGACIFFALLPIFLNDKNFSDEMLRFEDMYKDNYPDIEKAADSLAALCRQIYVGMTSVSGIFNHNLPANPMMLKIASIERGDYTPTDCLYGHFTVFDGGSREKMHTGGGYTREDFLKDFDMKMPLTPEQQKLIPELPEEFIIPDEVVALCQHAQASTGGTKKFRNFLLRGPAGTGKTWSAKAVASGLHLPYYKYTCSSGTEIFDFIGQFVPDEDGNERSGEEIDRLKALEEENATGSIFSFENVSALLELPSFADMQFDPEEAYETLTGVSKPDALTKDCVGIAQERVAKKIADLIAAQQKPKSESISYHYQTTDFLKCIEFGGVVEIQEPTVILQPGVLVGLNSLLEQGGMITLPNGRVIRRHPNAVVIITTNLSYAGCRDMNQSVINRMGLAFTMPFPSDSVLFARLKASTGIEDDELLMNMIKVRGDMSDYCRKHSITDGEVGFRDLLDWASSYLITGDARKSAEWTILAKATTDEDAVEALRVTCLDPVFPE